VSLDNDFPSLVLRNSACGQYLSAVEADHKITVLGANHKVSEILYHNKWRDETRAYWPAAGRFFRELLLNPLFCSGSNRFGAKPSVEAIPK
jgi:hypothetical protein